MRLGGHQGGEGQYWQACDSHTACWAWGRLLAPTPCSSRGPCLLRTLVSHGNKGSSDLTRLRSSTQTASICPAQHSPPCTKGQRAGLGTALLQSQQLFRHNLGPCPRARKPSPSWKGQTEMTGTADLSAPMALPASRHHGTPGLGAAMPPPTLAMPRAGWVGEPTVCSGPGRARTGRWGVGRFGAQHPGSGETCDHGAALSYLAGPCRSQPKLNAGRQLQVRELTPVPHSKMR